MQRRSRERGAVLLEYALILAFIVAIGIVFASENGLGNSIGTAFTKVEQLLSGETAADDQAASKKGYSIADYVYAAWNGNGSGKQKNTSSHYYKSRISSSELIDLEPGTYTFEISGDQVSFKYYVGPLLYTEANGTGNLQVDADGNEIKNGFDYGWVTGNKNNPNAGLGTGLTSVYNADTNSYTLTFTATETNHYLGINLRNADDSDLTPEQASALGNALKNAKITKVNN